MIALPNLARRIGRRRRPKLELMKPSTNITAPRRLSTRRAALALVAACTAALAGCHPDMWNQPRYTALQKNAFFADNAADRLPVPNTVPYIGTRRAWTAPIFAELSGQDLAPHAPDDVFFTGREVQGFKAGNFFPVTKGLHQRGQERFNAMCSHCHGVGGHGNGMIVKRGFPVPASYHIDRLREVEDGYIVDVIKNGFGRMYSYNARVAAEDRWAIAAYIRALQYSQNVPTGELSDADRQELDKALHPEPVAEQHQADPNAH